MHHEFWLAAKTFLVVSAITTLTAKDTLAQSNKTDRLALLNIKLHISDDPKGVLKSWNDTNHHCHWEGVTCGIRHQRVTQLNLQGKKLLGTMSPYIGNLTFLKSIELGDNRFHGEIPEEIGLLFRLKNLNLSSNNLSGNIPVNISHCSQLRFLRIFTNGLMGKIPMELGFLKNLVYLDFFQNYLTKEIPVSLGNLSSLEALILSFNNLEGNLPNEIGSLRNLRDLELGANQFSGVIPSSLYNISTLSMFSLAQNFLEGKLPKDFGLKMPNLQFLYFGANLFSSNIPVSIVNATNLKVLDIPENEFEGQVPTDMGNLLNLQKLNLGGNLLGRGGNGDLHFITSLANCSALQFLDFSHNDFGGQLPHSIGNLSLQVQEMYMEANYITGAIPISLMNLVNLYGLGMEGNFFTGTIPREIGRLQSLQLLNLQVNFLTGEISSAFCNLTSLYQLALHNNFLEGTLPPCFGNSQSLKKLYIYYNKLSGNISPTIFGNSFAPLELDLSHNSFSGPLPSEVGKLAGIIAFNVSYNNFSGKIAEIIGDFPYLEDLRMQCNFFQGTIPPKLASLKAIQYLDLSQNNLTGQIPKDLEMLPSLKYLNLSFNNLEGQVPRNGAFANSSQVMLLGNSKLCGGIAKFQLPSCPSHTHRKKNWKLLIIIIVFSIFALVLISATLLYCYRRRYRKNDSSQVLSAEDKYFLRISYQELHRATGGFSQENIVGSGNFGVVYKGQLDGQNGKLVAVKVLNLEKLGASKSFKAECNALRNIRHRNLVSVLSVCSSIDYKGKEFKALVYDFMENGSLDTWLHSETDDGTRQRNLNFLQRVDIAIDVASALEYLHNYSGSIIAHCDLKPSNILLDNNLTAHVGDFGLARHLPHAMTSSFGNGTSSSIAIKGTIGYAAPEYALGCEASRQGDAYSYGILLLEMFTGKRPTDENFTNDLNLHNYVKKNLSEQVTEILDPILHFKQEEEENRGMNCTISIYKIGLKCSETSPNDRIGMEEVTRQLLIIKNSFLRGETD